MTQSQDTIKADVGFTVRWYHALAAGLLYAGLMLLAFPPLSVYGVSFIAALPLLLLAWKSQRPFRHGLLVSVGMLPFYAYHCDYVFNITAAGYLPLVVYLSAWAGMFVWFAGLLRRRFPQLPAAVLLPVVWTGLDALRGEVVMGGFEWYQIGQPLIAMPAVARVASVGGGYLLTVLLIALCAVVIDLQRLGKPRKLIGWVAMLLAVGAWVNPFYGSAVHTHGGETAVSVGLVQTNVPQDNKIGWTHDQRLSDFRNFVDLTNSVAGDEPDLIVWPETMFPGHALDDAGANAIERDGFGNANGFRDSLLGFQRELGIPMLIGAATYEGLRIDEDGRQSQDATYNSAYLLSDGRVLPGRYDKLAPTPFGETLPYIKSNPWLESMVLRIGLGASGMSFGLDAGERAEPLVLKLESGEVHVATPICFESTQSRICRRIVNGGDGADLMIVMTNDGWFGVSDHVRSMHLLLARWRCVELGLPMARVANSGRSCFIDSSGRVLSTLASREAGVLVGEVLIDASRARTWYSSIGNLVGWLSIAGLAVLLSGAAYTRIKEHASRVKEEVGKA